MEISRSVLVRMSFWVGLIVVASASCREAEPPGVEIVEPVEGAVLADTNVRVVLRARGVEIAPASDPRAGTAHHHLFIDREVTPLQDTIPAGVLGILHLGRGQTEFVLEELEPGEHRVIALLADHSHVPLEPTTADTVRFTVQP